MQGTLFEIPQPQQRRKQKRRIDTTANAKRAVELIIAGADIRAALKLAGATMNALRFEVNNNFHLYKSKLDLEALNDFFWQNLPPEKVEAIKRAIKAYREGATVRSLEERFGISKTNLHFHIQNAGHHGQRQKDSGLINVVKENIAQIKSRRRLEEAKKWYEENKEFLLSCNESGDTDLLSARQESRLTWFETGHTEDFAEVFDSWNPDFVGDSWDDEHQ